MSFLAPWALVVGAVAAGATLLLHLVARQRPAAYLLPTARFIPDRRTLVSRVSRRPRDLLLLLLRLLLIASAAAAFARPVLAPHRAPRLRILLVDRSAAVADPADVLARARALVADGVRTLVVGFDSTTALLGEGSAALDSLGARRGPAGVAAGSISAALAAARRLGATEGARADSVELVLVTPVTTGELDEATDSLRAQWPGAVQLTRVPARVDSGSPWPLEHALGESDVLWPALAQPALAQPAVAPSGHAVRIVRHAVAPADSAFARAGGAVVRWDSIGALPLAPAAVAMGDDVVVAALARRALPVGGTAIAHWADGAPAVVERPLGEGCIREVAIGVPVAGDLHLRPAFQRIVRGIAAPCAGGVAAAGAPADSSVVSRLIRAGSAASGTQLAGGSAHPSPVTPWLLALAILFALLELVARARRPEEGA